MSAPEFAEQQAVLQWWSSYCRTKGLDERLLVSIPNGSVLAGDARARAIQMARLKATGLRVGFPDLMLCLPMRLPHSPAMLFAGMFVEMKKKGGKKPTPEQLSYHALLRDRGYNVICLYGAEEAIRAIKAYVERCV